MYITTKIDLFIYLFQNMINMPCGNFLLCIVSHFLDHQTIINNHNEQWRFLCISPTCQILIDG